MSGDNGGCFAVSKEQEKPENIRLTYLNSQDGTMLGDIEYRGAEEILIPDYDADKHDVYIRKVFVSDPNVELWKIESLSIQNLSVTITISPQEGSTSLGMTAKAQRRAAAQYFAKSIFN